MKKRSASQTSASGKKKSVSKKSSVVSIPEDTSALRSMEEIREKLWRALPKVQEELSSADGGTVELPDVYSRDDEESQQAVEQYLQEFGHVVVPWSDMQQAVTCLYLATHGNPTPDDVEIAVQSVVGSAAEREKDSYERPDLYALLDSIPAKWLPHVKQLVGKDSEAAVKSFNERLIDCVTDDEPPNALLEPEKVLTVATPSMLVSHIADFIQFTQHRAYPEVFDTLWNNMTNGRQTAVIGLPDFRVFFVWFYRLHFLNTSVTRSEAAAEAVFKRHLNASGAMDMTSFRLACDSMCAEYAGERNAAQYLQHLVEAATARLTAKNMETTGSPFFTLTCELIERIRETDRRILKNPNDLYLKDELRFWLHDRDLYKRALSNNRIVLHGRRFTGKTTVGKALAEKLRCVHLDVVDLAVRAYEEAALTLPEAAEDNLDDNGQPLPPDPYTEVLLQLLECVQTRAPISLDTQAALVRHEMETAGAYYHGYVLSDTPDLALVPPGDDDAVQALNNFYEQCGVAKSLVPSAFVHITADSAVYEQLRAAHRAHAAAHEAELSALEDGNLNEERDGIRLECQRIIAHAREVEAREDATEEEIAEAQQQAAESQQILDSLDAEGGGGANADGADDTEEEKRQRQADRQSRVTRLLIETLVEKAREEALYKGSATSEQDNTADTRSLPSVVSVLKRPYEVATSLQRVLSVDTTSTVADSCTYIAQALQALPCPTARPPITFSSDAEAPTNEEEMANVKLEAAQTEGIPFSPVWKQYCPVTLLEDNVLIEGSPCYSSIYRGNLYVFASSAKERSFNANPAKYLAQWPTDRKMLFVIADDSLRRAMEQQRSAPPHKGPTSLERCEAVVDELWQRLLLTPMTFADYAERAGFRRELQGNRSDVLSKRREYEETEREQRSVRLEKRLKGMKKKKQPKKNTKTKGKGRGSTADGGSERVTIKVESPRRPQKQRSRLEDSIQAQIDALKLKRRDEVPVLITLLNDTADLELVKLLTTEGALPHNVIVLSEEAPSSNGEGGADGADEAEEDAQAQKPVAESVADLVSFFEKPPRDMQKITDDAIFATSTINIYGKAQKQLVHEVLQIVNPCMVAVEEGVVDEELGENVEEEEEEEEEDEDDPLRPPKPREVVDPVVRPVKKFLNQFGTRLNYCPVTLKEKRLLLRGRTDLCAKYLDGLYCFASEENMAKFQRNPLEYVREEPPRDIPPRVWIVGASRSGKRSLGRRITETFGVPSFSYDRNFFERVVEAAQKEGGEEVSGIYIPHTDPAECEYLARAARYLKDLREFAAEQEKKLKLQKEAERIMEERERRAEEELDEDDSEEEPELDEDYEQQLQENLEFEPEEEEDRQVRLSEAYLRIMSCVSRVEPFESRGYAMICPPFSEGDLEVLFAEGGIPEVVVNMSLTPEVYTERARRAIDADDQRRAAERERAGATAALTAAQKAKLAEKKRKERELRKWRRRHIGENDPPSAEDDDNEEGNDGPNDDDEVEMRVDVEGTRQLEEEAHGEFLQGVEDRRVQVVKINAERSQPVVMQCAIDTLSKHLADRLSIFYSPEVVTYDAAARMIEAGTVVLSNFRYTDPVLLHDKRQGARREARWKAEGSSLVDEPGSHRPSTLPLADDHELVSNDGGGSSQQRDRADGDGDDDNNNNGNNYAELLADEEMSDIEDDELAEMRERLERKARRREDKMKLRVAILGRKAFFFSNDASLKRFLKNPISYIEQPPPAPKMVTLPAVSVFEDDVVVAGRSALMGRKSRSLAESIAHNTGFIFVNATKLLAWASLQPRLGALATEAIACTLRGTVDDSFLATVLRARLAAADVKARGAVLLNLPRTPDAAESIRKYPSAAPIMKVATAFPKLDSSAANAAAAAGTTSAPARLMAAWAETVRSDLANHALVELPLPRPALPRDMANLTGAVQYLDSFVENEETQALSAALAFPSSLDNTYHTLHHMEAHLSDYGWYCPYSWYVEQNLENTRGAERMFGAVYLGKYYFFRCEKYLVRFLLEPTEVADPSNISPLPPSLPEILHPDDPSSIPLELGGCCPVLLYDTRQNRGLRGATEPLAKKGSLDYLASYEGKNYALLNEEHLQRFMRRPWQYVGGAFLPEARKLPLAPGATVDKETFIRRQLYDAVASAMIEAAQMRPKYPGLSAEESALKYIALYLKSHNEAENNPIQMSQFVENFQLYQQRSSLYRRIDVERLFSSPDDSNMIDVCIEYDALANGISPVKDLYHLKNVPLKPRHLQ